MLYREIPNKGSTNLEPAPEAGLSHTTSQQVHPQGPPITAVVSTLCMFITGYLTLPQDLKSEASCMVLRFWPADSTRLSLHIRPRHGARALTQYKQHDLLWHLRKSRFRTCSLKRCSNISVSMRAAPVRVRIFAKDFGWCYILYPNTISFGDM